MTNKEPECVRLKRLGSELWYEKVKDMTWEERLKYYEALSREFRDWVEILKEQRLSSSTK